MKPNEWKKLWRGTWRGNVDIETRWTQKIAERLQGKYRY
jgi:hypothetical protein